MSRDFPDLLSYSRDKSSSLRPESPFDRDASKSPLKEGSI